MEEKLDRLLRYHRQRVFDDVTGPLHERAIRRLKATPTARAIFQRRSDRLMEIVSARLLATWA